MTLKLYYDLMSQPSRAMYIFLKKCDIPFDSKLINLAKGAHFSEEYERINPFKKVPAIDHDGFKLAESIAMMRYLCREFKVDDHWYPKDSKAQARVDEYLEWQHLNTRLFCAMYFQTKVLIPLLEGEPPKESQVKMFETNMIQCLDQIETIWLKDNKLFLAGDEISIADVIAACEIEQPRMAGYDARESRPKLSAWLDRVVKKTSPYYEEAHVYLNKLVKKFNQQSSHL